MAYSLRYASAIFFCLSALLGCELPKDPSRTSQTVRGDVLIVGTDGPVPPENEAEKAALTRLAANLNARLEYRQAGIHALAADLESGEIHVLAGGLPRNTPFKNRFGLSSPVSEVLLDGKREKTVFAIRKGENGFLLQVNKAVGD
ncbi:hypothetical protein [Oricola cellulosilytica]|uniref:Uncharacterized protein n=1 Tax=Oricola cellulosilytica TaxID=1429082 RepID=A0A4V2MPR5_9HYPH|nr:hypothetical protein [Oricola cellulosilytica]TCD15187.1 hypothetical protein E0D97_06475 [Oricola cellulosilytica]